MSSKGKHWKNSSEMKEKNRIARIKYWSNIQKKERVRRAKLANFGNKVPPALGKRWKHNEEMKKKYKDSWKKYPRIKGQERLRGLIDWTNKKHTDETKRKIGEKNWKGGKKKLDYGIEFDKKLKELVKTRDMKVCQLCNNEPKKRLQVHHIDYNKKNNNPNNLIALCNSCHTKTNFNRNFWKEYFIDLQSFNYLLKEILENKKKKSLDYGNSEKIFGLTGIVEQINNKIIRLWNLQSLKIKPANESIKDTYRDLATYCLMALDAINNGRIEPDEKEMSKLFRRRFNQIIIRLSK